MHTPGQLATYGRLSRSCFWRLEMLCRRRIAQSGEHVSRAIQTPPGKRDPGRPAPTFKPEAYMLRNIYITKRVSDLICPTRESVTELGDDHIHISNSPGTTHQGIVLRVHTRSKCTAAVPLLCRSLTLIVCCHVLQRVGSTYNSRQY